MATQTEAEKKAAEAAGKKPVVPKEMRDRLLKGQETPQETPEAKSKREADEKTAKEKTERDAKEKSDREAKETKDAEDKKLKKITSTLPPIPAAPAPAAGVTEAQVKRIVADAKADPLPVAPANLSPEDRSDLELAEFAAKQHGDKYADFPKRVSEWFGRRDQFLEAKAKELGGRDSADFRDFVKGDEFGRFVRENAPSYQRGDYKKIHEEHIEERGAQRAHAKIKPELDEIKNRQRQIEQTPVIERTVAEGASIMLRDTDATPDEALVEFAKNPNDFVKANEVEGGIIVRHATFFADAMRETLRITSGLVPAEQLENLTPTQKWIDSFISGKEQEMQQRFPNGFQLDDGSILVSSAQLAQIKAARPANASSYRTMLPAEIVGAIAVEGRLEIKRQLDAERKKLERSGFTRAKKPLGEPNGAKLPAIPPIESPMAGSAPARGAGGGGAPGRAEPYFMKYVTGRE